MPLKYTSHPAYPSLRQHPLAGAYMAIFWALLLVASVTGYSVLHSGEAHASDSAESAADH